MSYLNLASLRFCTESEGPGRRLAIWVQGCDRHCEGCCNPAMQEFKPNIIVQVSDLISLIEKSYTENNIEGISLIGGEPILQAEGLSEVAEWAQSRGLTVLLFTGFLEEELHAMGNKYVEKLLSFTDILVDGPFIQAEYDEERDWVGSRNQRVIFLSDAYKPGVEYAKHERQVEFLVSSQDVLINGWPFDDDKFSSR